MAAEPQNPIEETLRLSRNETELMIARYRSYFFAFGIVVALLLKFLANVPPEPAEMCAVGVAYGLILWLRVRRSGATYNLMIVGIVLDMLVAGAIFAVTRAVNGKPADPRGELFPLLILPAVLFCLTLLNSLRYSRVAAVVGGIAAQAAFWSVELYMARWHPSLAGAAAMLAFGSYLVYRGALRARENLDRFARLDLLRRYLSPTAVQRVMETNPDEALALGGELQVVTLLAADLRDFTSMSEKLSAKEVVAQLNEYHGAMLEQIDRHGGVLDKFIGDGTLAVFGLAAMGKSALADHGASAAVACARDMKAALERLNQKRGTRGLVPLRMGVGIHTGPVVAGNIGAPGRRLEFTVIGDAVNTAARLEGLTKQAGVPVLVSVETANRLAEPKGLEPLPAMHAKGKEEALQVFGLAAVQSKEPAANVLPAGAIAATH